MTRDHLKRTAEICSAYKPDSFMQFYEPYLEPWRDEPIKFLEIGVFMGGSIKTWREYFANAIIIAADVNQELKTNVPDGCEFALVNQHHPEQLRELGETYGPFDVVLDDGCHQRSTQYMTFRELWPFVAPGGIFIMEDLHCSNSSGGDYNNPACPASRAPSSFLNALKNGEELEIEFKTRAMKMSERLSTLEFIDSVASVEVISGGHSTSVVRKKK